MRFNEAHAAYHDDIKVTALSQRVPGQDYDDVVNEMTICLWRACQTWTPQEGTKFGAYWWSLWSNRKVDLIKAHYAQKRPRTVTTDDVSVVAPERSYEMHLNPEPPVDSNEQERLVWDLLSIGEPVKDILDITDMSKRSYYSTLERWRTDDVRDGLMDG